MADDPGVNITFLPNPTEGKTKEPLYATPPPQLPDIETERSQILGLFGFADSDVPLPAIGDPTPAATAGTPAVPGVPAPAAPADPAAPPADPAAAPATPATPAKRAPNRLPSASEIAKEAADRALREAGVTAAPTPPPEPETPEDAELKLRFDALKLLQSDNSQYSKRDLKAEYDGYLKNLDDYKKSWEARHPDEAFNLEDSQHDSWREAKEPDIDEDDIKAAEIEVKLLKKFDGRERDSQMKRFHETLVHRAAEDSQRTVSELLSFADGTKYNSLEELNKADWAAALIAKTLIPEAAALTATATSLLTPGSPVQYDPTRPDHQQIAQLVRDYETEVMKWTPEKRLDVHGRPYVPGEQYMKLSAREQSKAWTFRYAPDAMRDLIANEFKAVAKAQLEEARARSGATAQGSAPGTAPNSPPPRPPSGGAGPSASPSATRPTESSNDVFWTS